LKILSLPALSLVMAAIMWGLFWYPLRLLEQAGMAGLWVILVAYLSTFIASLFLGFQPVRDYRKHPVALFFLAILAGWCNASFVMAVLEGNVVRVVLLFFLSPVWAILLARVFLREHLDLLGFITLLLAMSGAIIMLWQPEFGKPWPLSYADWLGLSAGITFAASNVLIRHMQGIPVKTKVTITWFGCTVVALVWVLISGVSIPNVNISVWFGSVMLGLLGVTLMTIFSQYGVTHMPVQRSSVIMLFEIVVAAVSSYLIAGERLTALEMSGGMLIILSAIISARRKQESV
jgi:drug/metabolite transporter (DMT)-like permease